MNGSLRILKAMLRNSLVSMKVSNIRNRYETEVIYHMLETFNWFSSWLIECYVMLDLGQFEIINKLYVLKLMHRYVRFEMLHMC